MNGSIICYEDAFKHNRYDTCQCRSPTPSSAKGTRETPPPRQRSSEEAEYLQERIIEPSSIGKKEGADKACLYSFTPRQRSVVLW